VLTTRGKKENNKHKIDSDSHAVVFVPEVVPVSTLAKRWYIDSVCPSGQSIFVKNGKSSF
jgi:hypothetical protein